MTVKLTQDLYWFTESYDLGKDPYPKKVHMSTYMISHGENNILIDTGSFLDRESIISQVEEAVGSESLDGIIISHEDLPHSGNLRELIERFDDPVMVGGTESAEFFGYPEGIQEGNLGEINEICGRDFWIGSALLGDINHSIWAIDYVDNVLFPIDGMGYYHSPGDVDKTYAELSSESLVENIDGYHRENLRWISYTEPRVLITAIRDFLDEHDVEYIAPIHGNPIEEDDIDSFMEDYEEAIFRIASDFGLEDRDRTNGRAIR